MTMPLAKLDLLLGYAAAFALVAVIQATVVSLLAFGALGVEVAGPRSAVVALAVANATLGMALGLFVSAFATTEFQAVQFMPALVLPQLLLSGLFVARDEMARWLQWISDALPLVYAYDALARVARGGSYGSSFVLDVTVTLGAVVLALTSVRQRCGGAPRDEEPPRNPAVAEKDGVRRESANSLMPPCRPERNMGSALSLDRK
jgi:ABC-2 type transport system permease protein